MALALKRIPLDSPKALHYLYYWGRIRHRTTRILTLTFRHTPQVTIEYEVKCCEVVQMHDKGDITGGEAYFPALCAALASLSHTLPITAIADLPQGAAIRRNTVLTDDGQFEAATEDNVAHAIYGIVPLRKGDPRFNDRACGNPLLRLDLDGLGEDDLAALTRIDGHIATMKTRLDLPNLTYLGGSARFPALEVCNMPALQVVAGSVVAMKLSRGSFPLLQTVGGNLFFDRPKAISVPALNAVDGSTKKAIAIKKQYCP